MIRRSIGPLLAGAAKQFPVVVLTGSRQSGKTSTAKSLFGKTHKYVLLEDPDTRVLIRQDPRGFLQRHTGPVVLDEFQHVPEIANYLQGLVDENRTRYGQFILTGSQNFRMMEQVSQSLAGRAAILTLFPFSLAEYSRPVTTSVDVDHWLLQGSYPEPATRTELNIGLWTSSYVQTYLERDLRRMMNVGDLSTFDRFLRLVAARTASLLNVSNLARDCGVSVTHTQRWLSILEASFQILRVEPWFANLSKRLIRSPKIYATDTGLLCGLCGVQTERVLSIHPLRGNIFETAVVMEFKKTLSLMANPPQLNFFRTAQGLEADLLIETPTHLILGEIKSSHTPDPSWGAPLSEIEKLLKKKVTKIVVAPTKERIALGSGVELIPLQDIAQWLAEELEF